MKLFIFAASLRKDSCNKKLIAVVKKISQDKGITVDSADFSEFSVPLYNEDIEKNIGFPQALLTK